MRINSWGLITGYLGFMCLAMIGCQSFGIAWWWNQNPCAMFSRVNKYQVSVLCYFMGDITVLNYAYCCISKCVPYLAITIEAGLHQKMGSHRAQAHALLLFFTVVWIQTCVVRDVYCNPLIQCFWPSSKSTRSTTKRCVRTPAVEGPACHRGASMNS